MIDVFFYLFAALTVVPALLMVVARNPVNGAMFLIVSFVGMAALLVLLEAFFLAAAACYAVAALAVRRL
jgi:NADH-quinone oxidoreductase subunit J